MLRDLDIWRCAIVKRDAARISQADLTAENLLWLPPARRFAFRADPFGLWDAGQLHIFVEAFDYRELKGSIELLVYDDHFNFIRKRTVLTKPWHLSYPFVFRADDEIWMLPEARRSGALTLYRANPFPDEWEATAVLDIPAGAVDATPLFHANRWWLFFARGAGARAELNLAHAERLTGPWTMHPQSPLHVGSVGARPAGTSVAREDGGIDLPVQDCSTTYGGSIRRLSVTKLDPEHFEAQDRPWLEPQPSLSPFVDGLHTLSAAGDISLIDCKRIDRSLLGNIARQRGSLAKRMRRWTATNGKPA